MGFYDAMLGKISDEGEELELLGGLNFIGFVISKDEANNRYNIESPAVTAVQDSRQVIAGAGLTGGGDLSTDRTFTIVAGDSTITVNADSIQVGTIGNTNLSDNTIALARLVNAAAQFRIMGRKSSGAGSWESCTLAELGIVPDSREVFVDGINLTGGGQLDDDVTITLNDDLTNMTSINGATIGAPTQGTAITTTSTVNISNGCKYDVTAASAYTITLGTSGSPADGDTVTFRCTNSLANAITVTNGGTGGGNIGISGGMPAGTKAEYYFYYDGTATAWKYGGRQRIS